MDFSFLKEFKSSGVPMLKTHITDALRNGIITGRLKPGQQLQQDKIAAAMGVSSIPVREALSALREEQHVVYRPNKGAFVSEIDVEKIREIFEIRFFLESGALSLALPKFTDEDFEEAEQLMHQEEEETNANKKARLDLAYHMALCKPSGRPNLLRLIEQIHGHVARFVNLSVYMTNFKRHPEFHHGELFAACQEKDIEKSTTVLKNHLRIASDIVCSKFEADT